MNKSFILNALAVSLATSAHASVVFSGSYAETFDALPTTTVAGVFSATVGAQALISGAPAWQGTKVSGTGTTATGLTADIGTGNSGGIYSYGAATVAERALGVLASAGNIMAFGASFTNNSGGSLDTFTLSFTSEFWRSSTTTTNTLTFAYGLSGGTATETSFLTDATLTAFAPLNLVGPVFGATNGPLDGNAPANQAAVSASIPGLVLADGQTLFIRFTDTNDGGNDAGLAVDGFSLTAAAVPEPSTYAMLIGGAGLMLVVMRRKRVA